MNTPIKRAIDYFHVALTMEEEEDRREQFGLLFRSLGHVIHHIQDMAQPYTAVTS